MEPHENNPNTFSGSPIPGNKKSHTAQNTILLLGLLSAIWLIRLTTLGLAPLFDPTEGRYAEIAKQMLVSGDWVTPRLDYVTPFWGKPPLHFWITAISLKLFGFNAFAARFPSFLCALLMLILTGGLAQRMYGRMYALWSMLIISSSALFYVAAGYVVTDVTLALCVTGALCAFMLIDYFHTPTATITCKYAFFVFLGLGMLAKGPIAIVLCALPLGLWALLTRRREKIKNLPWMSGSLLTILICAPWYALAESRTPGFLNYFFIHEHVLRYLKRDYGDLYNVAHTYPYGTIWVLGTIGLLPWLSLYPSPIWHAVRQRAWTNLRGNSSETFLLCWALAPLLFFSTARNVVITYVLPAFPPLVILGGKIVLDYVTANPTSGFSSLPRRRAFSILITTAGCLVLFGCGCGIYYLNSKSELPLYGQTIGVALACLGIVLLIHAHRQQKDYLQIVYISCLIPVMTTYFIVFASQPLGRVASTRDLVATINADPRTANKAIVFHGDVPYSAEFYSNTPTFSLKKDFSLPLVQDRLLVIKKSRLKKELLRSVQQLKHVKSYGPYELYTQ